MAEAAAEAKPSAKDGKKGGMVPLLIGVVAAIALGGGAAYGVMSGLIPTPDLSADPATKEEKKEEVALAFLELPPISVPLPPEDGRARQLRLALSVETTADQILEVEAQAPRLLDALNTLLRAIDEDDIAKPAALDLLRAQMLRRLRLATHPEAIRDLLIVEYVVL